MESLHRHWRLHQSSATMDKHSESSLWCILDCTKPYNAISEFVTGWKPTLEPAGNASFLIMQDLVMQKHELRSKEILAYETNGRFLAHTANSSHLTRLDTSVCIKFHVDHSYSLGVMVPKAIFLPFCTVTPKIQGGCPKINRHIA